MSGSLFRLSRAGLSICVSGGDYAVRGQSGANSSDTGLTGLTGREPT